MGFRKVHQRIEWPLSTKGSNLRQAAAIPGQETLYDLAMGGVSRGNSKLSCLWHSNFQMLGLLLGTATCWGSFQHWSCHEYRLQMFQMQWHQKLTELTHRTSLGGGRKPLKAGQQGKQLLLEPCVISMAAAQWHIHSSAAGRKGTVTPAVPDQLCQTAAVPPQLPPSLTSADLTQAVITNSMLCSNAGFLFNRKKSSLREATSVPFVPKVLVLQFLWFYHCFTPITSLFLLP